MWEKIFIYPSVPEFETVPFSLLRCYPFEQNGYRPYVHGRFLFVKNDGFYFYFTAFEQSPKNGGNELLHGSALSVSFSPFGTEKRLFVAADGFSRCRSFVLDSGRRSDAVGSPQPEVSEAVTGGDQQGDYFTITLKIPLEFYCDIFRTGTLHEGDKLNFNAFYTILENNSGHRPHFVSLFETENESPKKALFSPECTGVLTAVEF